MDPEIFADVDFCQGCGARKLVTFVRCLGCMQLFRRCTACYPSFISCSEACRKKHREKMNSYFGKNAPPLTGEGGL